MVYKKLHTVQEVLPNSEVRLRITNPKEKKNFSNSEYCIGCCIVVLATRVEGIVLSISSPCVFGIYVVCSFSSRSVENLSCRSIFHFIFLENLPKVNNKNIIYNMNGISSEWSKSENFDLRSWVQIPPQVEVIERRPFTRNTSRNLS